MKKLIRLLFRRPCVGVYIGPESVALTTGSYIKGRWQIDQVLTKSIVDGRQETAVHASTLAHALSDLFEKTKVSSLPLQVVFDDTMVKFFYQKLSKKPDTDELEPMLQWQAKQVLRDVDKYSLVSSIYTDNKEYHLHGAAIRNEYLECIEGIADRKKMIWLYADSSAAIQWNSLDKQLKQSSGILIRLGSQGWTLFSWNANGVLTMIRPARWSVDDIGSPMIKKGMIEAARLATTHYENTGESRPDYIYLDCGEMTADHGEIAKLFGSSSDSIIPYQRPYFNLPNSVSEVQESSLSAMVSVPR